MSDKLDMIYDLLKQDREEAADFRKEVRESHKTTGERLSNLEQKSEIHNQQLGEHMRRTEILEDLHGINAGRIEKHEERIDELEKPKIVLGTIKKWAGWVTVVAGAAVAISKFMGLF